MGNILYFRADEDDFSAQITDKTYEGKTVTPRSTAAEPIENDEDIVRIANYILYERPYRQERMRYRDYLLFVLGINIGLRAGDLRKLKVGDILDDTGHLKREIVLVEQKTEHTNKTKKFRKIWLNADAREALRLYLKDRPLSLNEPLFVNCSRNNSEKFFATVSQKPCDEKTQRRRKDGVNDGIDSYSMSRILKKIFAELGIDVHASSHMLRKTFAHRLSKTEGGVDIAQATLNHSSRRMTLHYTGAEGRSAEAAIMGLSLGLHDPHQDTKSRKEVAAV